MRPVEAGSGEAPRIFPAAVSGGVLGLLLLSVWWIEEWFLKPFPCLLNRMTGVPCLGCGGTRALKALAGGDVGGAFLFNPLLTLVAGGVLAWLALAVALPFAPGGVRDGCEGLWKRSKRGLGVAVVLVALVHWIYLILFLDEGR